MPSRNKVCKTALVPHRILNKTSIYLAKQCKVDKNNFLGYEAVIPLLDKGCITVQSTSRLSPHDGIVFDFVLSQWQSTKKVNPSLSELSVNVEDIMRALKLKNRTENRAKVIQHLKNMSRVNISYTYDKFEIIFNMLDSVTIVSGTHTVSIVVSQTYEKAIKEAHGRYINVDKAMSLKNSHAIELQKLLQMDGQGVVTRTWESQFAKEIEHQRICDYLHLGNHKRDLDEVRRAFKALETIGAQPYKYCSRTGKWNQV